MYQLKLAHGTKGGRATVNSVKKMVVPRNTSTNRFPPTRRTDAAICAAFLEAIVCRVCYCLRRRSYRTGIMDSEY